ncbi:MAG TPA: MFS transporter [Gammaproteobacteria bacterium]|nr:MFS transporter [Gammaproteobacteria bacterium]
MSTYTFTRQEKKIITLAALGGMLEFYDFIIYGVFSVYFAHQFFPATSGLVTVMESYLVFVLGYLARPIGGIIFSHIGDEYGRKKILMLTIILMGIASAGIGLLPTYAEIGFAAPVLLLILRLTQGLALGGELPGTYVYIAETMSEKRGMAFGLTMAGVNSGLLLGMFVNFLLNYFLTMEQLTRFGWRLPFIVGGAVCIVSYRIRKTLQETTAFQKIQDKPTLPLIYLLKHHLIKCLSGIALVSLMSGLAVAAVIFMPTWLKEMVGLDAGSISRLMMIVMVLNIVTIYFTGKLTARYGSFAVLKNLLLLSGFLIPFGYFLISHGYITFGLVIIGCLEGAAVMITPCVIATLFESKIRLTGVALSYNIGFTLFGGLGPLVITNAIRAGHGIYVTPCVYLLVMAVVCAGGLVCLGLSRKEVQKGVLAGEFAG